MSDLKPVWLLDVDGVINLFDDAVKAWPDVERFTCLGFQITWSPTLMRRIRAVHDAGFAEVRWLTTWEDLANEHLTGPFSLPELAVAGRRPSHDSLRSWWKLPHAQAVYEAGVRVIWTDDDIAFASDAKAWLDEVGPERMTAVSPRGGLLPEHLDLIERTLATPYTEQETTNG